MKLERCRDLFERALLLLRAVVAEASDEKRSFSLVEAYVQRHANSLVWLADDAKVLIDSGCFAAVPLIVRSMLESGFILAAAVNEPGFAGEKMLREVINFRRRISVHLENDPLLSEFEDLERRIREEANFSGSPRKLSVKETADIAKLDINYQFEYFLYSQHTHAEIGGLTARHFEESLPTRNLRTMAYVLTLAAAFTPQLLDTDTPQLHVDHAAIILGELVDALKEDRPNTGEA